MDSGRPWTEADMGSEGGTVCSREEPWPGWGGSRQGAEARVRPACPEGCVDGVGRVRPPWRLGVSKAQLEGEGWAEAGRHPGEGLEGWGKLKFGEGWPWAGWGGSWGSGVSSVPYLLGGASGQGGLTSLDPPSFFRDA